MLKNTEAIGRACHSQEIGGGAHARRRSASGCDVQLRGPGATRARRPPTAGDPGDGRHRTPGAVARVCPALSQDRAPIDPAREAAPACCCRCSTRCGASGSSWSNSTTTSSSAGSWGSAWMTPSGIHGVHQESGAAPPGRYRPGLLRAGVGAGAGRPAPLGGAFHRGRHLIEAWRAQELRAKGARSHRPTIRAIRR